MSDSELLLAVSDWVIVVYDGIHFPGEETELDESAKDVKVSVMHKSGAHWKWPRKTDSILYKRAAAGCC